MALETRPLPTLKGKEAREFWEKVDNFKITETKEEIQEAKRKFKEMLERSKAEGNVWPGV